MSNSLDKNLSLIDDQIRKFVTDIVKDSYKENKDIYLKTCYDLKEYIISFLSIKTGNVIATTIPITILMDDCINKRLESKLNFLVRKMIVRFDDNHQDKIIWV